VEIRPREIADDEYVSQYGSQQRGFQDRPRIQDTDGLSGILGELTPAEARRRVRRVGAPTGDDGVRYARVGDLRAAYFEVRHTPWPGNTLHVSIRYPSEWDDAVAGTFNRCFSDPVWHQRTGGRA